MNDPMEMPGESIWVAFGNAYDTDVWPQEGQRVTVKRGEHKGKTGIIRAVDGAGCFIHIRTGDPKAWEKWDAETAKMVEEMRGSK